MWFKKTSLKFLEPVWFVSFILHLFKGNWMSTASWLFDEWDSLVSSCCWHILLKIVSQTEILVCQWWKFKNERKKSFISHTGRSWLTFYNIASVTDQDEPNQIHDHFFTDGRTPCTGDQLVTRPLPEHRNNRHRENSYTHQTFMHSVGSEPTILVSERVKTVHAIDRSATVTGEKHLIAAYILHYNQYSCTLFKQERPFSTSSP
jgi:hypothetical protein